MENRVTGVMIYYYFVCKRKLWYFINEINMESDIRMVKMYHPDTLRTSAAVLRSAEAASGLKMMVSIQLRSQHRMRLVIRQRITVWRSR
mgnify:CR=1 FL=1